MVNGSPSQDKCNNTQWLPPIVLQNSKQQTQEHVHVRLHYDRNPKCFEIIDIKKINLSIRCFYFVPINQPRRFFVQKDRERDSEGGGKRRKRHWSSRIGHSASAELSVSRKCRGKVGFVSDHSEPSCSNTSFFTGVSGCGHSFRMCSRSCSRFAQLVSHARHLKWPRPLEDSAGDSGPSATAPASGSDGSRSCAGGSTSVIASRAGGSSELWKKCKMFVGAVVTEVMVGMQSWTMVEFINYLRRNEHVRISKDLTRNVQTVIKTGSPFAAQLLNQLPSFFKSLKFYFSKRLVNRQLRKKKFGWSNFIFLYF